MANAVAEKGIAEAANLKHVEKTGGSRSPGVSEEAARIAAQMKKTQETAGDRVSLKAIREGRRPIDAVQTDELLKKFGDRSEPDTPRGRAEVAIDFANKVCEQ